MSTTREETTRNSSKDKPPESNPTKIDRNAPAGSGNSLGAESVREGRPSTDDSVVEATRASSPPDSASVRTCAASVCTVTGRS
jgi:hypothetical protein